MSTNRSVGRSASTNKVGRLTATNTKDRSRLCAFTFADGRQCRTPRCSGHLHLCYFHAQKEAERLAAQQVGEDISRFLPAKLLTACDLSGAMARVFCAIARGDVKPKVASTLAYLSQSMLQSIPIARHEYCEAFGSDAWRREIRSCFHVPAPQPKPAPQPAPKPAPKAPASASAPPTPVEAGLQAGPAPQPEHPGQTQPQPASSASSSSSSSPAPQPTVNCHSACPDPVGERSAEPAAASSSNSPLATSCLSPDVPTLRRANVPTIFAPATHHSPLPPSPHKPLPPTSAEFAQQVLGGLPTGSLPATPHVPTNCHSERSEESAFSSSSAPSTTPAPASPPKATPPSPSAPPPAPPPVPPGFGAPANWDVLIPPKPRRRFSRHGQLRE
jgi:hypothetical protein